MSTILPALLLFLLGLLLIIKGGDLFVDAASWMAAVSGIPKFVVGATVVSLATTLPELLVSLFAALDGKVDMAIGNAIGSVTANSGLILALSALLIPSAARRKEFSFKGVLLLTVIGALWFLSRGGALNLRSSLILLALLGCFIGENLHTGRLNPQGEGRTPFHPRELPPRLAGFLLGAGGIVIGSQLLVHYGSFLARSMGVSERIISVTAIAIGTSLPELITAITAIRRHDTALSVGNILGANIIDTTLILPVCAMASGGSLPVPAATLALDFPFCLGVCAVAVLPTLVTQRLNRWQGLVCLALYGLYLGLTCL